MNKDFDVAYTGMHNMVWEVLFTYTITTPTAVVKAFSFNPPLLRCSKKSHQVILSGEGIMASCLHLRQGFQDPYK